MGPIGPDLARLPGQAELPACAEEAVGIWLPQAALLRRSGGWALAGQSVRRYLHGYFGSDKRLGLSGRIRFLDQFTAVPAHHGPVSRKPAGTVFRVGHDLLLTAGHCLRQVHRQVLYDLADMVIAFGFGAQAQRRRFLRTQDVLDGADLEVLAGSFDPADISVPDAAILRLPSAAVNARRSTFPLPTQAVPVQSGQAIYMLGHRHGLPCMVTPGRITSTMNNRLPFVFTDLTAFEGNSGSPVFDCKSHCLLGWVTGGLPHVGYGIELRMNDTRFDATVIPLQQPSIRQYDYAYSQSTTAGCRMMTLNSLLLSLLHAESSAG